MNIINCKTNVTKAQSSTKILKIELNHDFQYNEEKMSTHKMI